MTSVTASDMITSDGDNGNAMEVYNCKLNISCSAALPKSPLLSSPSSSYPLLSSEIKISRQTSNPVGTVMLYNMPIVSLVIEKQERLCLAQISNTLLKEFSYNEIHNRRVALGITCVQCTPVQLEILRRAGAMPVTSRRCGMITTREAERLCKSFLCDSAAPKLSEDFEFQVYHECAWGCKGSFIPSRYNSSRAKCIKCSYCAIYFSPNKFIFHSHKTRIICKYVQTDAANFNSWRRHIKLAGNTKDEVTYAWEDVKAMFNGGTRKRILSSASLLTHRRSAVAAGVLPYSKQSPLAPDQQLGKIVSPVPLPVTVIDYIWRQDVQSITSSGTGTGTMYSRNIFPWFYNSAVPKYRFDEQTPGCSGFTEESIISRMRNRVYHPHSAFQPVYKSNDHFKVHDQRCGCNNGDGYYFGDIRNEDDTDVDQLETIDIETCNET